jgi:hypothetical protein
LTSAPPSRTSSLRKLSGINAAADYSVGSGDASVMR